MNTFEFVDQQLKEAEDKNQLRFLRSRSSFENEKYGHVTIDGKELLLFAGNDYLGLSQHPQVIQAAKDCLDEYGLGSGASQLVSGHTEEHAALEERLIQFMEKEACLLFPSGYQANMSVVSSLVEKDDIVIMDKLNHASLIDGCRLSGAEFRVFPHKNYERLEELLKSNTEKRRKLIVSDTVFSMDGDLADLETLIRLKEKYNAILLVDEAHAVGVFGLKGNGLAHEKNCSDKIDVITGTLSKSVGTQGGFVVASKKFIDSLINFARPFIFSTGLPPHICRASRVALDLIENEKSLRQKLLWNVFTLRDEMVRDLKFELAPTESPILPIMIGDSQEAVDFSSRLYEQGIYVPAIRPPAVPPGKARLRLTLSAAHCEQDIEQLLLALQKAK